MGLGQRDKAAFDKLVKERVNSILKERNANSNVNNSKDVKKRESIKKDVAKAPQSDNQQHRLLLAALMNHRINQKFSKVRNEAENEMKSVAIDFSKKQNESKEKYKEYLLMYHQKQLYDRLSKEYEALSVLNRKLVESSQLDHLMQRLRNSADMMEIKSIQPIDTNLLKELLFRISSKTMSTLTRKQSLLTAIAEKSAKLDEFEQKYSECNALLLKIRDLNTRLSRLHLLTKSYAIQLIQMQKNNKSVI